MGNYQSYKIPELFAEYVLPKLSSGTVCALVRFHMRFIVGDTMRSGNRVLEQIFFDRAGRNKLKVTTETEKANEQHYEVPTDFFLAHLGPKLKYSACRWSKRPLGEWWTTNQSGGPESGSKSDDKAISTLAEAETFTLDEYGSLAGLDELPKGSRVLELGCGWGSNVLRNAERFPNLYFSCFSNSQTQIEHIRKTAKSLGLTNLTAVVEDYAVFATDRSVFEGKTFDLAFAIETLEHAQDIASLISGVRRRLVVGGKFFVHSLLHQTHSYIQTDDTWMGRNFFSGGSILGLNSYFHLCPEGLHIESMWPVDGRDYKKTLLAWLAVLETPEVQAKIRKEPWFRESFYQNFRMFYIVSAEAFGANDGGEFMCAYYLFKKVA